MITRLRAEVAWFGRTVTPTERRFAGWLGWVSIIVITGLTLTGIWQFFSHEPNPDWFSYTPENGLIGSSKPSTGGAELHALFGDAAFVIALFGGAWFAYKILFRVPKFATVAALVALGANITGSVIRFNAVKISGRTLEQAGDGYVQIFTDDVEFVVNGRQELGPTAIRLLTFGHIVSVPVLSIAAWYVLTRSHRNRQGEAPATDHPSSA
jgi:hypothetical protein